MKGRPNLGMHQPEANVHRGSTPRSHLPLKGHSFIHTLSISSTCSGVRITPTNVSLSTSVVTDLTLHRWWGYRFDAELGLKRVLRAPISASDPVQRRYRASMSAHDSHLSFLSRKPSKGTFLPPAIPIKPESCVARRRREPTRCGRKVLDVFVDVHPRWEAPPRRKGYVGQDDGLTLTNSS